MGVSRAAVNVVMSFFWRGGYVTNESVVAYCHSEEHGYGIKDDINISVFFFRYNDFYYVEFCTYSGFYF